MVPRTRTKASSVSVLAAALLLAACDTSYYATRPAGAFLDEGGFGRPTEANMRLQSGQQSPLVNLNQKFASQVPTMVNFAFNSAVLDPQSQQILAQQADWIRQFPEVRFRVYGHTDAVGSNGFNKTLGLRRANAVVAYLTGMGISRSRLEAVVSFGETQPLIVSQGRERANRRTVTEVSGFVSRHPTVVDGKYAAIVYRDYIASAVPPTQLSGSLTEIKAE